MGNIWNTAVFSRALVLASLVGVATSREGDWLDPVVPGSAAYTWQDESDLLGILDSATDQMLVAQAIAAQCADPGQPLSVQQRQDGYNIAGHILFSLGEYGDALTCFQGIAGLDPLQLNHYDLADAWRMIGQISRTLQSYSAAYDAYKASYETYLSAPDPEISEAMAAYILPFLAESAKRAGLPAKVFEYVDDAFVIYDQDLIPRLPDLLELAGDVALDEGNMKLAESYFTDHLANYPGYESSNLLKSTPLRIRIKLLQAQGIDVYEGCSPDSIANAFSLFTDPSFDGMLRRYDMANAIVSCMEEDGRTWSAFELRKAIVEELDEDLASPAASSDPVYMEFAQEVQVASLYKAAKMAVRSSLDHQLAQVWLGRIDTEFAGVNSYYQDLATDLQSEVQIVP